MHPREPNPIVLYDGVCGLCNGLNQFLLKRDHGDRLRFASLQSRLAEDLLRRHGADSKDLNTVYVVIDHGRPSERLLARSDAMLYLLDQLNGIWKLARRRQAVAEGVSRLGLQHRSAKSISRVRQVRIVFDAGPEVQRQVFGRAGSVANWNVRISLAVIA